MIRAGPIAPFVVVQRINKKTIVDGIGMFIEEDENARRFGDLNRFVELYVERIEAVRQFTGITNHGIHGHSSNAFAIRRRLPVSGAFVDFGGAVGKWSEFGFAQERQIGVVVTALPILDVVRPGLAARERLWDPMVIYQQIIIVIGVEYPG